MSPRTAYLVVGIALGFAAGLAVGLLIGGSEAAAAAWGLAGVLVGSGLSMWGERSRTDQARQEARRGVEIAALYELSIATNSYEGAWGNAVAPRIRAWTDGEELSPHEFDDELASVVYAEARRLRLASSLVYDEGIRDLADLWREASSDLMEADLAAPEFDTKKADAERNALSKTLDAEIRERIRDLQGPVEL